MTPQEFANSIRTKYPGSYDNVPDDELTRKVIAKYPVYASKVNLTSTTEQPNEGFLSSLATDYNKRGAKVQEIRKSDTNILGKAYKIGGQAAGLIGDVVGETAISAGKILLPKKAEEAVAKTATKIFSSQPVEQAVESYKAFKEKHPEAADYLEATVNIGSLFPIGVGAKTSGSVASKTLTKTGVALEKSGVKSAEVARASFVRELVRPEQTAKVLEEQVPRTSEVGSGIFKRSKIEPTTSEFNAEKELFDIPEVKETNTFQQNYNVIRDANIKEAVNLEKAVENNNFIIPKKEVASRLASAKEELAKSPVLVGDAERMADKLILGAVDFVNKNEGTGEGLLKAKKEFDAWVLKQKPKAFDSTAENAFSIANREVRNVFKTILDENAPNAQVKASLEKQTNLYNAMDNIQPKAAKEADTAIVRAFQKMANKVGLKNKIVQQIAAVAGVGGLGAAATFAPAAAVTGALLFLGYRGAKLALKPELRQSLGKLLQQAGGVVSPADRVILQQILKDSVTDAGEENQEVPKTEK